MLRSLLVLPIGMLLAAAPAAADHASLHATVTGDVAATDNVFAVPGNANPEADAFMQLRPGLLFAYDGPRIIHELSGQVEFLEYVLHSSKPSVTGTAGWKGFFTPGPRSELLMSVNGSFGQLNALTSRNSPDQTGIGVLPSSTAPIDVSEADASEYLSYIAGKDTRTSETGFARWTATNDNLAMPTTTSVAEVGGTGSLEHDFRSNSLALEAGASYLRLERITPPGVMPGSTREQQVNPRAVLVWRHDIDKEWSTSFDGGVIYVHPIGSDPFNPGVTLRSAPFPIFGGLVAYTESWGRATLSARRSVTPDLFVALNTVDDSAIAQLALPLPWFNQNQNARAPKLVGQASLGVERAQLVNPDTNALNGSFYLGHADVGVSWSPVPGQTYGVRYELIYQHGDSTAVLLTPSFHRDTLFFTFALRYPDRLAAQVPRRTQSVRADRKDLAPIGAEPVVPDPTEQLQQDDGGDSDR